MKKQINRFLASAKRQITTGAIIILTTILVQPLYLAIATSGCPLNGVQRECGLELGLQIGAIATALPFLWFGTGITILIIGLVKYRTYSTKS